MKTVSEIKDDLRTLRDDLFRTGESADTKLVASYLDRLLMSVEDLCDSLEAMETEVETVCKCCEAPMEMPMAAKSASKPRKAAKKAAKKPAKKKRR